jgi:hypothetical protein
VTENTTELDEFLKELSLSAYQDTPVPYEMVQLLCKKIVVAIADGDVPALDKLRNWFIVPPRSGKFALNMFGERTNLHELRGLLDTAFELVIPPRVAREVSGSQYKRSIIDFLNVAGPSMGWQIARMFCLDEEEIHVAATRLRSQGFLTGSMVNEQDPGYTWSLTPRGQRLYETLYK